MNDYRQRLADAVEEVFHRQYCGDGPCATSFGPEAALLADAVLAVRDEEMAELRAKAKRLQSDLAHTEETAIKVIAKRTEKAEAEVEKLRADLADANATLTELAPLSLGVRAEKAEAAVDRVRRFCELVVNASIRVQAIQQARDTLTILDGKEVRDPAVEAERDDVENRLQRLADEMLSERQEITETLRRQRREADDRAYEAEAATERVLKRALASAANYPDDTRTLIAAADFIASALDLKRPLVVADVLRRAQAWLDARSGGDAR